MADFDPTEHTHRRWNPLTESWVLCSPHRTKRPWQGAQESAEVPTLPEYDPKCYLCPGNERATGGKTDKYESTYVFENDFAALKPEQAKAGQEVTNPHPLIRLQPSRGKCFVICFNPAHNLTIAQLTTAPYSAATHIVPIIKVWQDVYAKIPRENAFISYMQIFENKGSAMGCSNPHPHGQVWSLDYVPEEPAKALSSQYRYSQEQQVGDGEPKSKTGRASLLLAYAHWEMQQPDSPRLVASNNDWIAVVPYWAVWPFEVLVLPRSTHINHLLDFAPAQVQSFAAIMGEVTLRYDNLFECSFPYSMGLHQRPIPPRTDTSSLTADQKQQEREWDEAQFHVHFYPPLLRSKTVRKFLVGFEMLGEPQRDLTPEQAAKRLRDVDATQHYTAKLAQK